MPTDQLHTILVTTPDQAHTCFALRHAAYLAAGAIEPRPDGLFRDAYDGQPHCTSWLLCDGDRSVGSLRTNVYSEAFGWRPTAAQERYADAIEAAIGRSSYLESNRFVMDPECVVPSIEPILVLFQRLCEQALLHQCRYFLTAVRQRHVKFYQRLFVDPISDLRTYPGLKAQMVLMGGATAEMHAKLLTDPMFHVCVDV